MAADRSSSTAPFVHPSGHAELPGPSGQARSALQYPVRVAGRLSCVTGSLRGQVLGSVALWVLDGGTNDCASMDPIGRASTSQPGVRGIPSLDSILPNHDCIGSQPRSFLSKSGL